MDWSLRLATQADAERLAASVHEGFASYREFAPPGWEPPSADGELALMDAALRSDDVWVMLAEVDEAAGRPRRDPLRRERAARLARARARRTSGSCSSSRRGRGRASRSSSTTRRCARRASAASPRSGCTPPRVRPARAASTSARAGWPRGRPSELPGFRMPVRRVPAADQQQRVTERRQARARPLPVEPVQRALGRARQAPPAVGHGVQLGVEAGGRRRAHQRPRGERDVVGRPVRPHAQAGAVCQRERLRRPGATGRARSRPGRRPDAAAGRPPRRPGRAAAGRRRGGAPAGTARRRTRPARRAARRRARSAPRRSPRARAASRPCPR